MVSFDVLLFEFDMFDNLVEGFIEVELFIIVLLCLLYLLFLLVFFVGLIICCGLNFVGWLLLIWFCCFFSNFYENIIVIIVVMVVVKNFLNVFLVWDFSLVFLFILFIIYCV